MSTPMVEHAHIEPHAACAEILRARLDASSPAVWRIRELRLDLVADVLAARSARVAHAWGESFAARVSAVVTRGADSDGILCFENHGAYLAQFAIDRAAGRAGQLWYYQEFFSLQMLPAGRAIAEAFIRVPEHGAQAVLRLASENRLDEILLSLTERDAGMIRRHCFPGPEAAATSADLSRWSGRLLDLLSQEPIRATGMVQQDACDELRWIARASLRFPGAERNSAALEAIDGLLALRRVLTSIQSALADRLAHDLAEERISVEECACIALQHGARSPERGLRFLAQIGRGDPDWAAQAVGSLLREQVPAALAGHTDETMISAHGGAFLLGPILSEFNVDQIAWSACCDDRQNEARASFLRHFVLAKCVGGDRAEEVLKDPALRVLSGHHGATHWEDAEFFGPLDLARAKAALLRTIAAAACSRSRSGCRRINVMFFCSAMFPGMCGSMRPHGRTKRGSARRCFNPRSILFAKPLATRPICCCVKALQCAPQKPHRPKASLDMCSAEIVSTMRLPRIYP